MTFVTTETCLEVHYEFKLVAILHPHTPRYESKVVCIHDIALSVVIE